MKIPKLKWWQWVLVVLGVILIIAASPFIVMGVIFYLAAREQAG